MQRKIASHLLFFTLLASMASAVTLTLVRPEDALIGSAGESRKVQIRITDSRPISGRVMVRGHLRRIGSDGKPGAKAIATFATQTDTVSGVYAVLASLDVTLPGAGFYDLDLRAHDEQGRQIGGYQANMAALTRTLATAPLRDWGVCTHFAHDKGSIPRSLELAKLAGFSRVRDEVYWEHIEKEPGVFKFPANSDAWINAAKNLGVSPLIVLSFGNVPAYPVEFAGSKGFPENEKSRALFVRYAEEVVRRYRHIVTHWEIWNEPQSWGEVGPAKYTELLKEVYPAIKAIDPKATVISCGGGGAGGGPSGDFMTGIIANGGLDFQDGFSIHPYTAPYEPDMGYECYDSAIPRVSIPVVWPHLERFAESNRRSDKRILEVWVTEMGWPSTDIGSGLSSELHQAASITRTLLLQRRHNKGAEAVFIYDFQDDGNHPLEKEHNFGLITTDYAPKPSYMATATLAATLGDRGWTKSLVETDDVKALRFGSERDSVVALWSVTPGVRSVSLTLSPGRYIARNWLGEDTELLVGGSGRLTVEASPLPMYLISKK